MVESPFLLTANCAFTTNQSKSISKNRVFAKAAYSALTGGCFPPCRVGSAGTGLAALDCFDDGRGGPHRPRRLPSPRDQTRYEPRTWRTVRRRAVSGGHGEA